MNFLITGGAGSVGRDLTSSLLEKGHGVRVLDKHAEALAPLGDKKPEWIQGLVEQYRAAGVPVFLKDNLRWPEKIQAHPAP